jgi:hypothetical protein
MELFAASTSPGRKHELLPFASRVLLVFRTISEVGLHKISKICTSEKYQFKMQILSLLSEESGMEKLRVCYTQR